MWCASRRPPLGVRLFLSHFAVSRRFSLQPSCHLAVSPFSSCSPLSPLPLSRRSPLPRSAPPPPPAVPLFLTLFYGKLLCFLLSLAFSARAAFATVFGMLQGNYARLSKCKDKALLVCEELDLPEATRMRLRIALAAEMDSFFFRSLPGARLPSASHKRVRAPPAHTTHLCLYRLRNLRYSSHNAIWASLLLFLIAAGLDALATVALIAEGELTIAVVVCVAIIFGSVASVLYVIYVFKNAFPGQTAANLLLEAGRTGGHLATR